MNFPLSLPKFQTLIHFLQRGGLVVVEPQRGHKVQSTPTPPVPSAQPYCDLMHFLLHVISLKGQILWFPSAMKPITHCAITRWPSPRPEIGDPLPSQDNLPWTVKSEALHGQPPMMWGNAGICKKIFQLEDQEIIRLFTDEYYTHHQILPSHLTFYLIVHETFPVSVTLHAVCKCFQKEKCVLLLGSITYSWWVFQTVWLGIFRACWKAVFTIFEYFFSFFRNLTLFQFVWKILFLNFLWTGKLSPRDTGKGCLMHQSNWGESLSDFSASSLPPKYFAALFPCCQAVVPPFLQHIPD